MKNKNLNILVTAMILLFASMIGYGLYKMYLGDYFTSNFFGGVFVLLICFVVYYLLFVSIKKLWSIPVILLSLIPILNSCNYAKSNQKVLVSDDCGMSWKEISAGGAVPKGTVNPCYQKVVLPNYPMQGQASFVSNLKGKVKMHIIIDYDYEITNGLKFMRKAKKLGSSNADVDSDAALNDKAFEGAENRIIDVNLKEISKNIFINEDIVELDQQDIEHDIEEKCNKLFEEYGLQLNFITLTFLPDEQTNEAIDVATAMRIYEANNLKELGSKIVEARAGATKVIVENKLKEESTK
jgi:hypothetical protein